MKTIKLNSEISLKNITDVDVEFEFCYNQYTVAKSLVKTVLGKLKDFHKSIPLNKNGEICWSKVKVGTPFAACIDSDLIKGKIQKENGIIYLCQNEKNGSSCNDRLGYKYAWAIEDGRLIYMASESVNLISLGEASKPKSYVGGKINKFSIDIHNGFVRIGCQGVSNAKIRELAKIIQNKK